MSSNFDLMQQLEADQTPNSNQIVETAFPAHDVDSNSYRQLEWANDEAMRLVQQIFLLQSQEPPRVVVFAGIDHGNGCSRICAAVGKALARSSLRHVCLV